MVDFREYANRIKEMYQIEKESFYDDFMCLLVDNEWFHIKPLWQNGQLLVEPDDFQPYLPAIQQYFTSDEMSIADKSSELMTLLRAKLPDTADKLKTFYESLDFPVDIKYYLSGFLLKFLKKDLCLLRDEEIKDFLAVAFEEMSKQYGDILTFFLTWLKEHYKTNYMNDYFMSKRKDNANSNEAYDSEEYLELLYCFFNEDYIIENEMYVKAAQSKNYVDTWLFLALHFICALRNSDIVRIHHPRLTMTPDEVLNQVLDGIFSDEDARLTLYSITWRLTALPLNPNKTKKHSGISSIKLCVPESVEIHIGTLLAIAEAHRQISNIPDTEPLIRIITDYDRITRYMGDEIGALFLESNFRTLAVNKSYLQSVFMLTDDILENDDEFIIKGYILAALARSHKGAYGEFATTTAIYLKDAKLSGLTPEFVARELFERGVLSFVPSMLLKMITNGDYNRLPVQKQTELIKKLALSPAEIEDTVAFSYKSRKQSMALVKEILSDEDDERNSILRILHRIGNGNAVSKQDECLCLISAMKKICPYSDRTSCIGCDFEISTKSTVFLMISEYNRLLTLYHNASEEKLKMKYRTLIKETVLPTIDELLQCIKEQYGDDALHSLEKIIKENTNG